MFYQQHHGYHNSGHHGQGFFGRFDRPMDFNVLGKFDALTPHVQRHLMRVYATLSTGLLAMMLGVYLNYKMNMAGIATQILGFAMVAGLAFVTDLYNRLAVFHGAALMLGCNLGPLINTVAILRPEIIMTALMGTMLVFACFSAAAMLAKRRHFLYLGGILGSFLSLLCTFRFINFIMGGSMSSGLFEIELYGGLFIFMGYIVFDTQMIIEDANTGRRDFVAHALDLLLDFIAVFVRLLIILMRNAEKKEKKERR